MVAERRGKEKHYRFARGRNAGRQVALSIDAGRRSRVTSKKITSSNFSNALAYLDFESPALQDAAALLEFTVCESAQSGVVHFYASLPRFGLPSSLRSPPH
jgi:hypothetical protein